MKVTWYKGKRCANFDDIDKKLVKGLIKKGYKPKEPEKKEPEKRRVPNG